MLCIGGALKYYKSLPEYSPKKFSYAKEDSLYAYFNNLEIDTLAKETGTLFQNEKPFLAKEKEQIPYTKKTFVGTLDINSASLAQLTALPGIGPKTAEQILKYRKRVGKIKSLNELLNIKGIGEKKISKLKSFLTLK